MPSRVSAFVIWAAVGLGAMYWALRLLVSAPAVPPHAVPAAMALGERGDPTRLLGGTGAPTGPLAATPAAPSRFRLVGVAAPKSGAAEDGGIALIAVDGKPARPFRVGAAVDGELVLRSVERRTASLGPARGAATMQLELPAMPAAATGTLAPPPPLAGDSAAPATATPPVQPGTQLPPAAQAPQLSRVPRTDVGAAPPGGGASGP